MSDASTGGSAGQPRKLAYLIHWNAGSTSGVVRKVVGQVRQWRDAGVETHVFVLSRRGADEAEAALRAGGASTSAWCYGNVLDRLQQTRRLARELLLWNPVAIYRRYDLYYPAFDSLARSVPTIVEVNTNDLAEYGAGAARRGFYNRLTRERVLGSAAGLVFVSGELADMPAFAKFRKPRAVLGNGIDLGDIRPAPPPRNPRPRLVFTGSPGSAWHGVDKVVSLATAVPEWHFDLIGFEKAVMQKVPPNLTAHGLLPRDRYEPLLRAADVGIGTLALHRKRMQEASPLKVREYLAWGVPAIIGYKDTDFPDAPPFLLRLPNEEDNVERSLGAIREFVVRWRGRRVERSLVAHLDARQKEHQRLQFICSLIRERLNAGRG